MGVKDEGEEIELTTPLDTMRLMDESEPVGSDEEELFMQTMHGHSYDEVDHGKSRGQVRLCSTKTLCIVP